MVGPDLHAGDPVGFIGYPELSWGSIVEHRPNQEGYIVEADNRIGGFGYSELIPLKERPTLTIWQRLLV